MHARNTTLKHLSAKRARRGLSMVGLLITVVCMFVLMFILLNALNTRITGNGATLQGTVRSTQDEMNLYALFQSLLAHSYDNRGRFLVPSDLDRRFDASVNTTANLYSAMIMDRIISPRQLISGNEFNGYVEPMEDYNYLAYDPGQGIYWDTAFRADLDRLSHASFAHMPLVGRRMDQHWKNSMAANIVIIGSRGPKDGIDNPQSWTYGRDGQWAGHHMHGDGSIQFTRSYTPTGIYFVADGQRQEDNVYRIDDGVGGIDSILSFTSAMQRDGPVLQWD